jgi:NADH-quinone oxidoreductase subunit J
MLAAPFIAAVQVIVYAGAIMVLVVFVIMLLNVEQEERKSGRLKFLVPAAVVLAAVLIAEVAFILVTVQDFRVTPASGASNVGLTHSIGSALFTQYLLPFEITSILLLMAIVGAMTLARRGGLLSATARVIPGAQQLPLSLVDSSVGIEDTQAVETDTTAEAAHLLGYERVSDETERE